MESVHPMAGWILSVMRYRCLGPLARSTDIVRSLLLAFITVAARLYLRAAKLTAQLNRRVIRENKPFLTHPLLNLLVLNAAVLAYL